MTSPAIRSITRNTIYLIGTRAINVASRLIWVAAAARILGPDLYALLAYSTTWHLAFMPLALFGIGPAFSYLIGADRKRAPEFTGHVLAIRLVTILVAAVVCVALSRIFIPDPRAPALIAILSLALAARALTTFTQTLFTAFEVNQYSMRQETFFSLLDLIVSLVILLRGGGVLLLVTAKAVIAWLQTAWAFSVTHRQVTPIRLSWQPRQWHPLMRLALPALMGTLATNWGFNGSLILFRNLTVDGILYGQYSLAMQALAITAIAPIALSRAAFPALRRAVTRNDGKELLFASSMQRIAPLVGTAVGLCGLSLGEPVFRWVLGEPFSKAGELVGLTLWCLIPMTSSAGYPEIMLAQGRFKAVVTILAAGAAVMTLLTFLLTPIYGVNGAIAAALLGFSVSPAGAFILAWRMKMADPVNEIIRPFTAAALGLGAYIALSTFSQWISLTVSLTTLGTAAVVLRVIRTDEIRTMYRKFISS